MDRPMDYFKLLLDGPEQEVKIYYDRLVLATKRTNYLLYCQLNDPVEKNARGHLRATTYELNHTSLRECRTLHHPFFMQVHQSFIVNLYQVRDLYPAPNSTKKYLLLMSTGREVPVSNKYLEKVKAIYLPHGKRKAQISPDSGRS